jgi:hypothetical protein
MLARGVRVSRREESLSARYSEQCLKVIGIPHAQIAFGITLIVSHHLAIARLRALMISNADCVSRGK